MTREQEIRARLEAPTAAAVEWDQPYQAVELLHAGWPVAVADILSHAPADLAYLLAEVARLTEERDDAREALRVEREDRARTLAALRDLAAYVEPPAERPHGLRTAYAHAADLVAGGGR